MEDVIILVNPKREIHTNLAELLSSVVVPLDNRHLTQNLSQEVLVVIYKTGIKIRYLDISDLDIIHELCRFFDLCKPQKI